MSFLVHPCTTCRGTGSLTIGADYERRGNLIRDEEVCPTCDGEGAVFEYDGECEADAHAPVPDAIRAEPMPAHYRGWNTTFAALIDHFAKARGRDKEPR